MKERIAGLVLACAVVFLSATPALAQTSSLSGVVVDSNGGVLPGVTVVVKNVATGTTFDAVTNTEGVFSVPALDAGAYTVTASLSGFKTAVVNDVRLAPGTPASIKATLEVGNLEETIVVTSSSELINTQTATISSTLNVDQINRMPTPSRNALNAVTFLPGVNTPGINRNSTVNGLPESFLNITLDGVSNADNFNKSTDGFFASVTPRQDAVEAVTVTTAAGGADTGGSGAVSINFVTRSGTNRFSGSLYEYFRHWELNSNYWFNKKDGLPRNEIKLNQYGGRVGGPIVLPGTLRRSREGVLLRQLRAAALPEQLHAQPNGPAPARATGHLQVQHRRPGARSEPPRSRQTKRPNRHDRPDGAGRCSIEINQAMATSGRADGAERSAADELSLAEPRQAVRAPAVGPPRFQPERQASTELLRLRHRYLPRPRLPEQPGCEVPRRAQLRAVRLAAPAVLRDAALDALLEHRQRASRRLDARGRVIFRRTWQPRAGDLCGGRRIRHRLRHEHRPHELAYEQRRELAECLHLLARRHAELAEGQARLSASAGRCS